MELLTRAGKGDGFEGYVRSYETVATTLGKAKVEITEQEVPGAEAARLFEIVSPPKKNANAAELRSRVLIVRRGGDLLVLSAGTQEDAKTTFDPDTVIVSFRIKSVDA